MISVVVPVYKVEKYLPFCVQSIILQTCSDWELILVDDGSPDRCGEICDQFAHQDARIRVIHKKNGGLADARNAGTAVAQGKYITYIDSDDWVAPQMLERLLEQAENTGAEVVICDLIRTETEELAFPLKAREKTKILTGQQAMEMMLYQTQFDTSACGKLFRTDLAVRFPFPEGRLYEDLFTTYKMLFSAPKVVYLAQAFYAYRQNQESIMNREFDQRNLDELDAAEQIVAFVQENCPQCLAAANSRKFSSYSQVLRWMKNEAINDMVLNQIRKKIWSFLRAYRWDMLWDRKARIKNRLAALCTLLGQEFFVKI